MKFLSNLDLKKNELMNAKAHCLAIPPQNPQTGMFYYNTTDDDFWVYTDEGWKSALYGDYYKKSETYTQTEVNTKLGGKANTTHNHDASNINTGTLSVDRIPSLPQSKITNLTTYLNNKVSYGETLMNTNPFGGKQLYINSINNAIFNADLRWTVTAKRYRKSDNVFIADVPTYTLFNGDYEGQITVPAGEYLVVNIKFLNSGSAYDGVSIFPGYPYGYIYISHYYTGFSESAKLRVYSNYSPHGIGWHEVNFTDFVRIGNSNLILQARQSKYAISEMELIITARDDIKAQITEIDFKLDRPGSNEMPLLDKLTNQIMYKDINFKGQARPKINGVNLITADDPRLSNSRPASDVSAWAKKSELAVSDIPDLSNYLYSSDPASNVTAGKIVNWDTAYTQISQSKSYSIIISEGQWVDLKRGVSVPGLKDSDTVILDGDNEIFAEYGLDAVIGIGTLTFSVGVKPPNSITIKYSIIKTGSGT